MTTPSTSSTSGIIVPFTRIASINKLNFIDDLASISTRINKNTWKVNLESPVIKKVLALLSTFPDLKRDYDAEFSRLLSSAKSTDDNSFTNDLAVLLDKYIKKMKLLPLFPPPPTTTESAHALVNGTGAIATFVETINPISNAKKAELKGYQIRQSQLVNIHKVGIEQIKTVADILISDNLIGRIDVPDGIDEPWIDLAFDFRREYDVLKKYIKKFGEKVDSNERLYVKHKYINFENDIYKIKSDLQWQAFLYDMDTLYIEYAQLVRYATSILLPQLYRVSEQKKELDDLRFQLRQRDEEIIRFRTEKANATRREWNRRNALNTTRRNERRINNNTRKSGNILSK
jgi:hypothetical protein